MFKFSNLYSIKFRMTKSIQAHLEIYLIDSMQRQHKLKKNILNC